MSKERLEEIEENAIVNKFYYKYTSELPSKDNWVNTYTLRQEDYDYLIKQAERVRELVEIINLQGEFNLKLSYEVDMVYEQSVRYRKSLKDRKSTRLNSSHVSI